MSRYDMTCPVCGKTYSTTHTEGRMWCSVGCQFGAGVSDDHAIDWRARCLAAESRIVEVEAEHDKSCAANDMLGALLRESIKDVVAEMACNLLHYDIAHRALVEGLAECERLRAMASTLSAFDILIGAPSKEMTEADLVEAMARLVTDPPSPMMDAREGAAAREQAIRADSAREERERSFRAGYAAGWDASGEGFNSEYARNFTHERWEAMCDEALAEYVKNTAHAPGKGGEG